jgi:hypothetical protein
MKLFSLNWFKSKKKEQLLDLQIEEQRIKNEIHKQELLGKTIQNHTSTVSVTATASFKPTIKLVNDVLTIILEDGSILSKPGATREDFELARKATTEEQLIKLCETPEVVMKKTLRDAEIKKARVFSKGFEELKKHDDVFVVEDGVVYFKEIKRSIPPLLLEEILLIVTENPEFREDDKFLGLKWFFMWCCLNPRAEVANDLYDFLKRNSFRITKQGFFVALRNVVRVSGNAQLVDFVSNMYNKIKAVWKKKPENYDVYMQDGEYQCHKTTCPGTYIGNLETLYKDLPNLDENRYTDAHTRTFDIRVGRVVNMPPEECSWSTADCAEAGLHFTADKIHYVGCGDTSVLILINPMKVVGIGQSKGRCYEYLPIMTVPTNEATEILHDLDFDTLELDEDYAIRELQNLEEKAKEGFVAEAVKYEFNFPNISTADIRDVVMSLEEMKSEIKRRIVRIC